MLTSRTTGRSRRLVRLSLAVGLLLAGTLTGRPAVAQPSLFFIGDSLTDTGNLYQATTVLNARSPQVPVQPPSPPYYSGRFSNGPTYAEVLPGLLGVSESNVFNLAFAGAESGETNAYPDPAVASLFNLLNVDALDQVGRAVGRGVAGPNSLAVYFIGANDYVNNAGRIAAGALTPQTLVGTVIGNINTGLGTLAGAGQRRFAVLNLPDMGRTPRALALGPSISAGLSQLTAAHNTALLSAVTVLESARELDITLVAMDDLFVDMLDNPALYGLSDTRRPCFYTAVASPEVRDCSTPETANAGLFYDGIHPTARTHQVAGQYVAAYLDMKANAGADITARSMLGLLSSRSQQRLMEARLLSARSGFGTDAVELGQFSLHLTGDFGMGDRDGDAGQRGFDYDTTAGMLGLDWRFHQSAMLGAGFGYSEADLELDGGRGRADLESWFGTVYGTVSNRAMYVDAAVGYAADDYRFSRPTGFSPRPTASANPRGSTWFALLSGGYNFQYGNTSFGPIIGGRWTESQLDGYQESAGPLALSVRSSVHESWVGFLGGQVSSLVQFGPVWVAPHLRITGEYDFGDEEQVRGRLGSGQTVSGKVADNEPAAVFGGGIEFGVGASLAAQVSGETSLTRAGGMDSGVQGRLIARF